MDSRAELVSLLESEFDVHLITLKFLALFGDRCQTRLEEGRDGWASLVWFDAGLFAWDRQAYPGAEWVVFVDGTSPSLLAFLTAQLPAGSLIVKTSDPRALAVLEQGLGWRAVRSFLWYSGVPQRGELGLVREVLRSDELLDALLIDNGYREDEVASFWSRGARGYVAEAPEARAFCLVYPNHGPVWEIASVKTLEAFRQQGWGARVVRAAAHSIVERGHRIRYHVDADNTASRALASSLGLVPLVRAEHYLRPFSPSR